MASTADESREGVWIVLDLVEGDDPQILGLWIGRPSVSQLMALPEPKGRKIQGFFRADMAEVEGGENACQRNR
jgi:hypothetical protein